MIRYIYLEDHQGAAYDAHVPVDHGFLHDVTDAAKMMGFNGVLLGQEICDWHVVTGCQQVELMDAHGTHVVQQLIDNLVRGYGISWKKQSCSF